MDEQKAAARSAMVGVVGRTNAAGGDLDLTLKCRISRQ